MKSRSVFTPSFRWNRFPDLCGMSTVIRILFCIPLTMMLGGCMKEDITARSASDGIGYDVLTVNHTRVADSYSSTVLPSSVVVWARITDENTTYIPGDIISKDKSGKWVDETATRYWPVGKALDFAAHVNGGGTFKYGTDGIPSFANFKVADEAGSQIDLMYAVSNEVSNTGKNVSLYFRHALSQICFEAQNNTTDIDITVKSVEITHLTNTGTYKFPTSSTTKDVQILQDGIEQTPKGEWTLDGDYTHTYTVDLGEGGIKLQRATTAGADTKTALTSPGTNGDNLKMLALLPQEVKAWDPATKGEGYNGACIILDVIMKNVTGEGDEGERVIYNGKVAVPVKVNWFEGCRYTYNMIFSQGGNGGWVADPNNPTPVLATIGYDVSVSEFTTESTDSNVDTDGEGQGNQDTENTVEEDPRNPLTKFATSNLGSSSTTRSGENSFLLYQWGRNQGYKDWKDALGELEYIDDSQPHHNGFAVYKYDFGSTGGGILSGTGGFPGLSSNWFENEPTYVNTLDDLKVKTGMYVMNAFPGQYDQYLDYWVNTYGSEQPDVNWGGRATACGYTATDPCPEGWRLPTEADFKEIFPSTATLSDQGAAELNLSSLQTEIRKTGDVDYAVTWEMNDEGLLVKCLVLDNATDTPDWTSKDVVTRTFPFTGAIVPETGDYTNWSNNGIKIRYATPYHKSTKVFIKEDRQFLIEAGEDTGRTFGGYWVSDAKKTFSFSNPEDGSGTLRLGNDHPARAYAIRPVKK